MRTGFILLIAIITIFLFKGRSQTYVDEDFDQAGRIILKVFSNFHADVSGDEVSNTAFEIRRAYLGYGHDFSKNLKGQVIFDASLSNETTRYGVFLKIAALSWNPSEKLTINGGLVSPTQFRTSERFWGYRYIYKSFQDEYKFGYSADLGMTAEYKFNKYILADVGVFNGEGYKNVNLKYGDFKGSAGITVKPFERLQLRVYYDIMNNNDTSLTAELRQNQSTLATFIGINITDKFRIGGEYNYQMQNRNIKDQDLFGYSFFTAYVFNTKFEVFGRIDILQSNKVAGETENWNYKKDAVGFLGGLQYIPLNGLKIALNYRHVEPTTPEVEATPASRSWVYLNVEFTF